MRVQFNTSATDVQLHDLVLGELIGGERGFDNFLDKYLPKLVATLQKDIETRDDLLIGDYGGVLLLEDRYGEYPFAIVLKLRKLRKTGKLVELAIEQLGFYSIERGREIAQEFTRQHGQDDRVNLS